MAIWSGIQSSMTRTFGAAWGREIEGQTWIKKLLRLSRARRRLLRELTPVRDRGIRNEREKADRFWHLFLAFDVFPIKDVFGIPSHIKKMLMQDADVAEPRLTCTVPGGGKSPVLTSKPNLSTEPARPILKSLSIFVRSSKLSVSAKRHLILFVVSMRFTHFQIRRRHFPLLRSRRSLVPG
jgi:hypothetical protein